MKNLGVKGKCSSLKLQISCIVLVILLTLYILNIGSFFNPVVYPLIDRVTYSTPFAEKYFLSKYLDQILILSMTLLWFLLSIENKLKHVLSVVFGLAIIAALLNHNPIIPEIFSLLSVPIISALVITNKISKKYFVLFDKNLFIDRLSALGIVIGISGLGISLAQIISPNLVLPPINYFYYIFLLFSIFSPILLIILAFPVPIKVLTIKMTNFLNGTKKESQLNSLPSHKTIRLGIRVLLLIGIIALSLVIVSIPHIDSVNNQNQIIGSDTKDYENLLDNMSSSSNFEELTIAFVSQIQGDRALSLVTFYLLSQFLDSSNLITSLELLPFVLAPLLVLSFYFVTLELTSNQFTSIVSSFLSVVSFQVMIGVYGGFYANWYALIFVNIAILFLIRAIRSPSRKNLISFSVLLLIVLLSHEPTWPIISMVIIVFLTILLVLNTSLKRTIYFLFLAIIPSISIESFKTIFMRDSGLIKNVSFASNQGLGFHDLNTMWSNLVALTQTYLAGQFNNSIIYGLVIYWVSICSIKDKSNLLIIIFLSILVLPILFADPEVMGRVIYEIPFSIPAAVALTQIHKNHGNTLFLSICLWLVALSIRSSLNFYFDA